MYQRFLIVHHLPSLCRREFLTTRFVHSSGYTSNWAKGPHLCSHGDLCSVSFVWDLEYDSIVPFRVRIYIADTSFNVYKISLSSLVGDLGLVLTFGFIRASGLLGQNISFMKVRISILATKMVWPWPFNSIFCTGWLPWLWSKAILQTRWSRLSVFIQHTGELFVSLAPPLAHRYFDSWLQNEFLETKFH